MTEKQKSKEEVRRRLHSEATSTAICPMSVYMNFDSLFPLKNCQHISFSILKTSFHGVFQEESEEVRGAPTKFEMDCVIILELDLYLLRNSIAM